MESRHLAFSAAAIVEVPSVPARPHYIVPVTAHLTCQVFAKHTCEAEQAARRCLVNTCTAGPLLAPASRFRPRLRFSPMEIERAAMCSERSLPGLTQGRIGRFSALDAAAIFLA